MKHKLYTSYYDNYDNIPSDWYCVALFNDAPQFMDSVSIRNFLYNHASLFSPSKELMESFKQNDSKLNKELEERYLKEVLDNFQQWKKVNQNFVGPSGEVNNFIDWINAFDRIIFEQDPEWKNIVFMTSELPNEDSFRQTFLKLMNYNKIQIVELSKEDLSAKKPNQKQIKQLF